MKKFLTTIGLCLVAACLATSCLKEEDTVTSPECAITAFSVGDIKTALTIQTADGSDSIVIRVVSGSGVTFNIDQLNGTIFSVDSLPSWVDISRVIPSVSYTGLIYCRQRGNDSYYAFTSGKDSVDFTQKVEFLVIAYDGLSTRHYDATIGQTDIEADSLYWSEQTSAQVTFDGALRTLVLDNRLLVFGEKAGVATVVSAATDSQPLAWTEAAATDVDIDVTTVLVADGRLLALGKDGCLYQCEGAAQGRTWTKTSDQPYDRLLAADANYVYACVDGQLMASTDLLTWTPCDIQDKEYLPTGSVATAAYATRTNSQLQHVVMMGASAADTNYATVWYKTSSADADLDGTWSWVAPPTDKTYAMPRLDNLQMVRYNGMLLALGGADASGNTQDAYRYLYRSDDNGVSWHKQTEKLGLPDALNASPAQMVGVAATTDGLWLVENGGRTWRGRMR